MTEIKSEEPKPNYSGRRFINQKGDWKKLEKLTKDISALADSMQNQVKELVKADTKLKQMQLEAYQLAPQVDCLFYDSPVAPSRQTLYLKMFLKKCGWDGARDIFMDESLPETFSSRIREGCAWLLKFRSDDQEAD